MFTYTLNLISTHRRAEIHSFKITHTHMTVEKDLGVTVTEGLTPELHVSRKVGEAFSLVRNIRAAFKYLDEEMMRRLIVTMTRPRLEYAAVVWSPSTKKDKGRLERVQRAASKLPATLADSSYEERLRKLKLPTLEERRERGDLIAVYRMLTGRESLDRNDLVTRDLRSARGHGMKIKMEMCRRDVKKNSFPQRTVAVWNKLGRDVVEAKTIHTFKDRLDLSRYGDGTARV